MTLTYLRRSSPDSCNEDAAHFTAHRWKAQHIDSISWLKEGGGNPPMTEGGKVEENLLSKRGNPDWTVSGWCGNCPGLNAKHSVRRSSHRSEAAGSRELLILVQLLLIMTTQPAMQELWVRSLAAITEAQQEEEKENTVITPVTMIGRWHYQCVFSHPAFCNRQTSLIFQGIVYSQWRERETFLEGSPEHLRWSSGLCLSLPLPVSPCWLRRDLGSSAPSELGAR